MILCVIFLGSFSFLSKLTFIRGISVLGATGSGKSFVGAPDVVELVNSPNLNDPSSSTQSSENRK